MLDFRYAKIKVDEESDEKISRKIITRVKNENQEQTGFRHLTKNVRRWRNIARETSRKR